MPTVWLDGRYVAERDAKIPATDPAVLWGAGLFDVLHAYHGRPFRAAAHAERLERSARTFGIDPRLPDLDRVVPRLLARNGLDEAYVRVTVTAGGHRCIIARPPAALPGGARTRGVRLEIAPWRRDPAAPLSGHKTLAYYELMVAREAASRRGAVDTVLLDPEGHVLEGARSTILAVRGGTLVTPRAPGRRRGILPGVTAAVVREVAVADRIPRASSPVTFDDLLAADEVLVTSTMMEVVPVVKIGRHTIGKPGPVTGRLARGYRALVERECAPGSPR